MAATLGRMAVCAGHASKLLGLGLISLTDGFVKERVFNGIVCNGDTAASWWKKRFVFEGALEELAHALPAVQVTAGQWLEHMC